MIVSGAAKPSSKVLSLVCFSISFFNYSTKKKGEKNEEPHDRCIGCVKKEWFEFELCIKSCNYESSFGCVNKIFASNQYWLWTLYTLMQYLCLFWGFCHRLAFVCHKTNTLFSDPKHGEVDQTESTTPLGLSDFKSIPFRVCNAPYTLAACTSHSQFISLGYYLTFPLSQVLSSHTPDLHTLGYCLLGFVSTEHGSRPHEDRESLML